MRSLKSKGHHAYNFVITESIPDSKVHGANMGPTWVLLSPGGPHVGPMNLAIWDQGAISIRKTVLPGMAIPMLKIRRPNGRLIFNMEIAIRR